MPPADAYWGFFHAADREWSYATLGVDSLAMMLLTHAHGDHYLGMVNVLTQIEKGSSSAVRVFIDYDLPAKPPARGLGRVFGRRYARWCVDRMLRDALRHLGRHQLIHVNGSRP